nr:ABC transporter permease [Saprospiraceae bacterium]
MIKNYLLIAWRNLLRNRGFTLINVMGLCAGLTCFVLIMLYVQSESGYDRFHNDSENIYRVGLERKYPGRSRFYATIPHSFAQAFEDEFAEVEDHCRLFYFDQNTLIKRGADVLEETKILWADSTFFDFFSIKVLSGDPGRLLSAPNSIVLTESAAIKYFGEDWANRGIEGEILDIVDNDNDPIVTGVCENIPAASHLVGDFVRSSTAFNFLQQPNYINFFAYTYLRLNENA